jgi:Ca2+-dependent lipid-binding protein
MGVKKVRAYIFQCRDIPAADSDGQSDPFIKLWDTTAEEKRTRVIEDNNNPLFYETLELTMETPPDVE